MGRQTSLTPKVQAEIVAKIEGGNFLSVAAQCGGITYKTFREWMKRGESDAEEDTDYRSFRDAVRRARAKAEADSVEFIKRSETWSAHAWFLERSFQKRWMKRDKGIELAGDDKPKSIIIPGLDGRPRPNDPG